MEDKQKLHIVKDTEPMPVSASDRAKRRYIRLIRKRLRRYAGKDPAIMNEVEGSARAAIADCSGAVTVDFLKEAAGTPDEWTKRYLDSLDSDQIRKRVVKKATAKRVSGIVAVILIGLAVAFSAYIWIANELTGSPTVIEESMSEAITILE